MGDDPGQDGLTKWAELSFVSVTGLILSAQEVFKAGLHLLFILTDSNWTTPQLFTFPVHKYNLPQTLNGLTCSLLQFACLELQFL